MDEIGAAFGCIIEDNLTEVRVVPLLCRIIGGYPDKGIDHTRSRTDGVDVGREDGAVDGDCVEMCQINKLTGHGCTSKFKTSECSSAVASPPMTGSGHPVRATSVERTGGGG